MTTLSSSSAERLLPFLKSQTFLGGLPDAALDALILRGHIRRFSKSELLCRRGDPGDSLMVIVSGRIKIANINADGKEVVLGFLGAGDVNGEIAVLDGKERSADAIALEESEVLVLYRRDLIPALTAHPRAMLEVMQIVCERLRSASAIIADNALAMRGRAAKGLLRLAEQHGRTSKDGVRIELMLSQDDLGKYLGLSRANVSRQLGQLKLANVLKIEGSQVVISDAKGLAEIAESASSD
jgi:CRP-like cAMP-binding protein